MSLEDVARQHRAAVVVIAQALRDFGRGLDSDLAERQAEAILARLASAPGKSLLLCYPEEVPARGYRIRSLVWTKWREDWWTAEVLCDGALHVEENDGAWSWRYIFDEYYDEGGPYPCASAEDGKAQAEAIYLSRLLPALEELK